LGIGWGWRGGTRKTVKALQELRWLEEDLEGWD
jgi:hypothetical protein